jgi:hypothetical protein
VRPPAEAAAAALCHTVLGVRLLAQRGGAPCARRCFESAAEAAAEVLLAPPPPAGPPAFRDAASPSDVDVLVAAVLLCAGAAARDGAAASVAVPTLEALVRADPARFLRADTAAALACMYECASDAAVASARNKRVLQAVAARYSLALPPAVFKLPPA